MRLDIWMHGEKVGMLRGEPDGTYALAYDPEAVERLGVGWPLLSTALPLRTEPYPFDAVRAYVEGLLPSGRLRSQIARGLGLSPDDGFGLIAALGRDCIGAATFLPAGEAPEPVDPDSVEWLDDEELAEALVGPAARPANAGWRPPVPFALPGERHKLAVVFDEENVRWAWPRAGLPSTHILKPESIERPGLASVEMACTTAYREMGLPVVLPAAGRVANVPCFGSVRFDRWGHWAKTERLHQESFAQALGLAPAAPGWLQKGAPSITESCRLLREVGEESAIENLMMAAVFDLVIGKTTMRPGDAALLHTEGTRILAPFYGNATTDIYGAVRPRPVVVGPDVPPAAFLIDLRFTIEHCGVDLQEGLVKSILQFTDLCHEIGKAADLAKEEGWYVEAIDRALMSALARTREFMARELAYIMPRGNQP